MGRSRNIKPGFFLNDELAEIEPLGRLLFAGIWTIADREGRLEDRPKKIKAAILPYDNCNVDELLQELFNRKFIIRYQIDNDAYIQITNWHKHQNPHYKEVPSEIPPPECHINQQINEVEITLQQDQTEVDSNLNQTQSDVDLNLNQPCTLIPDSLNLIPDPKLSIPDGMDGGSTPAAPACPHDDIIAAYHELLPTCPQVREWHKTRQGLLKSRWREDPKRQTLEWWRKYFAYVAESDFLTGRAEPRKGSPPFVATLEWLLRPTNFANVREGKYHNAG